MAELLVYQKPHVEKLLKALNKYNVAIDASDTGTGKTYCALACAQRLGLKPLIICPKAVLTSWKRAAKALNIEIEFITNYDQIISPAITSTRQQNEILQKMGLLDDNLADVNADNLVDVDADNLADVNANNLADVNADNLADVNTDNMSKTAKTKSAKSAKTKSAKSAKSDKLSALTSAKSADLAKSGKTTKKINMDVTTAKSKPYLKYCRKVFVKPGDENFVKTVKNTLDNNNEPENEGEDEPENEDIGENIDPEGGEIDFGKKDKQNKQDKQDKLKEGISTFEWTLPNNTMVIFDEVHRCKNIKTLHFKILASIKPYLGPNIKCLVLSATVADKIKFFAPVGYVLGWINDCTKYAVWLNRKSRETGFPKSKTLHHLIFPFHGSRIKISELGDLFPRNQVITECYDMENAREIEAQYEIIKKCIEDLRQKKDDAGCILAKITRARQMIELLKYPTFCELIDDHLDSDLSVVVFVNYTDTMMKLAKTFNTGSLIHGQQTEQERNKIIDDFQSNKTKLIIANIKAGGVGISLHDIHGGNQRVSIISPTWSAQDTVQTLGRIHRAEGKTTAIQKFVFCSGTIEEYICDKLKEKLDTLSTINDGILHPYSKLMEVPDSDSDSDADTDADSGSESESETESINEEIVSVDKKVKSQLKKVHKNDKKIKDKKSASEYLDV